MGTDEDDSDIPSDGEVGFGYILVELHLLAQNGDEYTLLVSDMGACDISDSDDAGELSDIEGTCDYYTQVNLISVGCGEGDSNCSDDDDSGPGGSDSGPGGSSSGGVSMVLVIGVLAVAGGAAYYFLI